MKKIALTVSVLTMLLMLVGCALEKTVQQNGQNTLQKNGVQEELEFSGKESMYLFVQNAHSGTLVPASAGENLFMLTLNGVSPQTIYFSDRPERDVGQVDMASFLDAMCGDKENPPNAALEILDGDEDGDVVVVELIDYEYDAEKESLQYSVRILEEPDHSLAVYNERHDTSIPETFGEVALFIDDCGDVTVDCYKYRTKTDGTYCGSTRCCTCFDWSAAGSCDFRDDCCSEARCKKTCQKEFGEECDEYQWPENY